MSLIAESSSALTLLPVSADLNIATKETFFMFNTKCYWQIDGVAIGSPLGPDFMWSFESKWLRYCPNDSKPVFYIRFIDDIKNILYSAVTHLILMVIQFLQPTTMTLKSR